MVKVIASSVRKGNILEVDSRLYAVISAESFFPGKGTPTTQIDMRGIADGVKTSQRYRTTEQVERAYVEEAEHSYLYKDGEDYVFMNPESFEQITVSGDVLGDQAVYLDEGMACILSVHRCFHRATAARDPGSDGDRADDEGANGVVLLQAGDPIQWRPRHGSRSHRGGHEDRRDDRRRRLR